ncbi:MAG TPA: SpoIIE family protein phosphatase [Bryobacteraceae bacterium]|nr:SpoIIE family protein phosphatase [Bryobacteraceae bacterium]
MNWPTIGGMKITAWRMVFLALVAVDVLLFALGAGSLGLTAVLAVWAVTIAFRERSRLIWKVRNRLIVTYMFIAVVPITLILAMIFVAGYLLMGQMASYLVSAAIDRRNQEVEKAARLLAAELPEDRLSTARHLTATGIPDFQVLVTGDSVFRYPANSTLDMPPRGWADYTGIIYKDGNHYLMSLATRGHNKALILRSLTLEDQANLVRGLGSIKLPVPPHEKVETKTGKPVRVGDVYFGDSSAGLLPPPQSVIDMELTWLPLVRIASWDRPNSEMVTPAILITRPSALFGIITQTEIGSSLEGILTAFYVVAALLGIAWIVSIYIGISMTRRITGAVHNLYEGTTHIGQGDLVHRIPAKGRDQLADLSRSFNNMAEQLGQFVAVARERERLQSEIAIASEVQTRLFPLRPPSARTVEMMGVCHAASSVSGDYYDYFAAAHGELALALGDVAGKGISAALLMASIQSIMRTQLSEGSEDYRPSASVARLNRLLYANTSPEKYATFFFGLYNDENRSLTYTNAGHLPPLLIQRDGYRFLDVTGSVVGAFPSLVYEEQTIPMEPGDVLVAYTDGITEPENAYGEDFGATRLADVVMRYRGAPVTTIVAKVLEAVRSWSSSAEQADDMTLMVVRSLA